MSKRKTSAAILTLLLLLVGVAFAATIELNDATGSSTSNISGLTPSIGIIITGNASNATISLNLSYTNNLYYPLTSNPSGYLTSFNETDPIFTAENASIWAAINNKLNTTDQQYNETIRKEDYNLTITTTGGNGTNTTPILHYAITNVRVTPAANLTYHFEAHETSGPSIDTDRVAHVGAWNIRKYHALNDTVTANIINATGDTTYTVTLTYLINDAQP